MNLKDKTITLQGQQLQLERRPKKTGRPCLDGTQGGDRWASIFTLKREYDYPQEPVQAPWSRRARGRRQGSRKAAALAAYKRAHFNREQQTQTVPSPEALKNNALKETEKAVTATEKSLMDVMFECSGYLRGEPLSRVCSVLEEREREMDGLWAILDNLSLDGAPPEARDW